MDIWTFVIGILIGFMIGFALAAAAVAAKVEQTKLETYREVFEECTTNSLEREKEIISQVKGDIWETKKLEAVIAERDAEIEQMQKDHDRLENEFMDLKRRYEVNRQPIGYLCSCFDFKECRCNGTKERDFCSCGGNKLACDFYPEVRSGAVTMFGGKEEEDV